MDLIYRDDGWLTETCVQYGGKHIQPLPDNLQVVLGCKFKGVYYVQVQDKSGTIKKETLHFGYADAKKAFTTIVGKKPQRIDDPRTGRSVVA